MSLKLRHYASPGDYLCGDDFLLAHYQPGNRDGNWLEPLREYMHGHPYLDGASLGRIGVWEDDGQLVAVAHYESRLGEAFFQFHPVDRHLRSERLNHAEHHLAARSAQDGQPILRAYINANDANFLALVRARGYQQEPQSDRPIYQVAIPEPFPAIPLPVGFRLTSLADECDWAKVHRIMWRGFNHDGEPPAGEDELESRRRMFDTPSARRDLKIAVVAPSGEFVALCGMFYVPAHRYAYVEPVATDPAYRRRGSDQVFYQALGFRQATNSECWVKELADAG